MVRYSAGEKKRRLILDVCKKLFYRKGYKSTTYHDICEAADIPAGSITYHFDGKRDIGAIIHAEYEAQNKIYIEKICNGAYDKTTLAVIENYHLWQKIFQDAHIRRFLLDLSGEKIPDRSTWDCIAYFYECVMDEQGVEIDDLEFGFIVSAQTGMTDELLRLTSLYPNDYTFDQPARFAVRFFLRQVGLDDETIAEYDRAGRAAFDALPIDLAYYRDFAYDESCIKTLS
ncbi:MAG TPA: TetR/AcrR family transcriptional regulator [Candidatus Aphodovivens avistercoris]|nr:TetR/AcrR family transcriptional regulator [Candidatus Aphodovivens avistercoris]